MVSPRLDFLSCVHKGRTSHGRETLPPDDHRITSQRGKSLSPWARSRCELSLTADSLCCSWLFTRLVVRTARRSRPPSLILVAGEAGATWWGCRGAVRG